MDFRIKYYVDNIAPTCHKINEERKKKQSSVEKHPFCGIL
jgi:hypothetical protein